MSVAAATRLKCPAAPTGGPLRFDRLGLFAKPEETVSALTIRMMKNERRSTAINITNSSQEERRVDIAVTDLPAGFSFGTDEWERAVGSWAKAFGRYMSSLGKDPSQTGTVLRGRTPQQ